MARKKVANAANDLLLEEMRAVKRLLILQLFVSGVPMRDIAIALGVSMSTVSRLVPFSKVKSAHN